MTLRVVARKFTAKIRPVQMPGPMNNSTKHLDFLDQFRAVAILLVLLGHTLMMVCADAVFLKWDGWFRQIPDLGSLGAFIPFSIALAGLPVFFVVSGFCIHLSFELQGKSWRGFFLRRSFRIFPAYLAALILSAAFTFQHFQLDFFNGGFWQNVLEHLFLVHNFSPGNISGFNPPFWSLATEFQLYLIYPVLLMLSQRFGWRRTMMALAAGELFIRGLADWYSDVAPLSSPAAHAIWIISHSPLGFWFSWSLGAYLAEAHLKQQPMPFSGQRPWLWLALAVGCCFIRPLVAFNFLVFALTTAVVASRILQGRSKLPLPASVGAGLRKIGLCSYSLYLLHQPLLYIWLYAFGLGLPNVSASSPLIFLALVASWLVIIPLSWLWYQVFELPGIALGKVTALRPPTASGPVTALRPHFKSVAMFLVMLAVCLWLYWANARFIPFDPSVTNNLAWSLATDPDPAKRDGARAVALAEDACRRMVQRQTVMVGTLAAAYAEAGRFEEAIATAQDACRMAEENGETNLLQRNKELLELYRQHSAYHQPPR